MRTRADSVDRGLILEYFTVAWNFLEAAVGIVAGAIAGSTALTGFGLDSLVEVSSGGILLWRLHSDADPNRRDAVERRALQLVGISLLVLAVYIAGKSVFALLRRDTPEQSWVGILLSVASLITMPILARAKRKVASNLASTALVADSRQTDICAYLAAILLLGLVLNALFGWWWTDSAASLLMVPLIAFEGIQAWRGKTCCEGCG